MRIRSVALAVSLFSASLLLAQSSLPPLTARVEVKVINVDATVVDRAGHPVTNLSKDDFEILEDGKPQKVTNFYLVDGQAVHAAPAAAAPTMSAEAPQGRFRRKVVLLVDNHFIDKHNRDVALVALENFIDADYAGEYEWSIAVIGSGVHVLQAFTTDKATIKASIDSVMKGSTIASATPIDTRAIADPAARPQTVSDSTPPAEAVYFQQRMAALVDADRGIQVTNMLAAMRSSAHAVIDACRAYTSLEGKKMVVLVTGGMEVENRAMEIPNWVKSTGAPIENDRIAGEIREQMVREANSANVSLYIVNATGTVSPVEGFDSSAGRIVDGGTGFVHNNDSLASALAAQTGGMYLTSNKVKDSIKKVDEISGTFYSLGYSATHYEDRRYHTIDVRVKEHPDYKILHRSGYLDLSSRDRLEDSMRVAMSAAVPEGTLPLQVNLGKPVPQDANQVTVPVTAAVPIARLTTIKQGDVNSGRIHVYISLFDKNGSNVGFQHMVQQIDLSDEQMQKLASMPDSNFRYQMKVKVKPGIYDAVVALVDELSEEVGKTSAIVDTRG
jgi:VWFA-related protein